jgi:hypothetical protein
LWKEEEADGGNNIEDLWDSRSISFF